MVKAARVDLVSATRKLLAARWEKIRSDASKHALQDVVDDPAIRDAISRSIRSKTKTYRYVLPTQLLAKLANGKLDARSIQAGSGDEGSFDARTIAHKVIVPFDAKNHNVLGGSSEPYVNNPLRVPKVSKAYVAAQKNKDGWNDLCSALDRVEERNNRKFTDTIFMQVLIEVHRALSETTVQYPVPMRISLDEMLEIIRAFLLDKSCGDRVQAVAGAVFTLIGSRFGLYKEVRRAAINATDASTGLVADLECIAERGKIVLAVEVKDRELTIAQIDSKLTTARAKKVQDILFVAQKGVKSSDQKMLPAKLQAEFAAGQNVYITTLSSLMMTVFSLLSESSRPELLELIGQQLELYRSDIRHRRDWAGLLANV